LYVRFHSPVARQIPRSSTRTSSSGAGTPLLSFSDGSISEGSQSSIDLSLHYCYAPPLSLSPPANLRRDHFISWSRAGVSTSKINSWFGFIDQPVPFLNSEVSLEEIDILGVPFRSLQISWNHLSSARVEWFTLEDIVRLFQHAPQMTDCHIFSPISHAPTLPPITLQGLKTLTLCGLGANLDAAFILIRSLTLPCLEEFRTNKMALLIPTSLPVLVERSSCPLTKITLLRGLESVIPDELQALPGVTEFWNT